MKLIVHLLLYAILILSLGSSPAYAIQDTLSPQSFFKHKPEVATTRTSPLTISIDPQKINLHFNNRKIEFVMQAATLQFAAEKFTIFRGITEEFIDRTLPQHKKSRTSFFGSIIEKPGKEPIILPFPIMSPATVSPYQEHERAGIEDPRCQIINDEIFISYTAYDGKTARVGLASIPISQFLDLIELSLQMFSPEFSLEYRTEKEMHNFLQKRWEDSWKRYGILYSGLYTNDKGEVTEYNNKDAIIIPQLDRLSLAGRRIPVFPVIHRRYRSDREAKEISLSYIEVTLDEKGEPHLKTNPDNPNQIKFLTDAKGQIITKTILKPSADDQHWTYQWIGINGEPSRFEVEGRTYYILYIHSGRWEKEISVNAEGEPAKHYKIGYVICDQDFNPVYIPENPLFEPNIKNPDTLLHRPGNWVPYVLISAGHFLESKIDTKNEVELGLQMIVTVDDSLLAQSSVTMKIKKEELLKTINEAGSYLTSHSQQQKLSALFTKAA